MQFSILILTGLITLFGSNFCHADIPNFHQVSPNIYRGGRPDADGIAWLAANGISTIIDLENDSSVVANEQTLATNAGLQFLSFPMSSLFTPQTAEVDDILSNIANLANQPVFVHCQHGENRTGLIIALYRVQFEGWTPLQAYNEMLSDGFDLGGRWALLPYFDEQTSFSSPGLW